MSPHDDKILGLLSRPDYAPLTLKKMAKQLDIDDENYPAFRSAVKDLAKAGKLDILKDKTLRKPGEKGTVVGTFRRLAKGFGFVRPAGKLDRSTDIFIPVDAGLDAATGDSVAVQVTKKAREAGFNDQGRVIRVLTRATGLFVGTYHEERRRGFVTIDGTNFNTPIYVGDPGAKGAKPGDKVAIEMVRYPTPEMNGEGVITELLGARGTPGVDTLTVLRAFGIPDEFDEETLQEAREQAKAFNPEALGTRLDLRQTPTITIDPVNARDFDDAISLSRDDRGYWSLGVHIADVGHFVRAGTALDQSARKRGTSVYLPDKVVPMLPEVLSNSLASLQQGQTRFTLSALMEFNSEGIRTGCTFARSAIKVDHRFAYERAYQAMFEPETPIEEASPEIRNLLMQMLELSRVLRDRRKKRGALQLNMPKVAVDLGENGEVVGAHLELTDEAHQLIEEFMLSANEAVAEHLTAEQVGYLRRGHADPDIGKLRTFAEFARSLGIKIDSPQSRFELQRVLDETADKPERYAIHYGLLRSLKQAIYTPEAEGHFALASDDYCHFTSPIRRYPDLQVHRALTALIEGKRPRSDPDELRVLAEHCTRTERRAEMAERELVKIKLLTYLLDKIGMQFHAIIIGVEEFGLFVQLVEFPVEGLIHVKTLGDDYYYLESETHTLIGRRAGTRYRLGDRVEVVVARVDVDRRELDLAFPGMAPAEPRKAEEPGRDRPAPPTRSDREGRRPVPKSAKGARPSRPKRAEKGKKKRK